MKQENKTVKAEIYNCRAWIQGTNSSEITEILNGFLKQVDYCVLNFVEHIFPNGGYTAVWLLAESHLAIHSFIEENKTYIELSGCNKTKNDEFKELLKNKFNEINFVK